jgi:alpha-beta hydrolase superfamily lysophospholipase
MRWLSALLLCLFAVVAPAAPAHASPPVNCQTAQVPVAVSLLPYQIAATACWHDVVADKPVEILVPGFTYDSTYWNFPYRPDRYSYVTAATLAGYVTFTIDPLGTGASSHPPSALLTGQAYASALHQVVSYVGAAYPRSRVVTVGHSAGSGQVLEEAADYGDVNGVILTGLLHVPDATDAPFFTSFHPAILDPAFGLSGLDPGYLTTQPGTRGSDFYNLSVADPAVVATDEATKSTGSAPLLATGDSSFLATTSQAIRVPVLLAVGQNDASFCDATLSQSCASPAAVLARESSDYGAAACLEAYVLPDSGHDINLHPNAPRWFAYANDWMTRHAYTGCA